MDQTEKSAPATFRAIVLDLVTREDLASRVNCAVQELFRTTGGRCPHITSFYSRSVDVFIVSVQPLTQQQIVWIRERRRNDRPTEFGYEYNVPTEVPTE